MCAQLLALSQLAAIGIWAFSLVLIGIIPSWEVAMFFSASSYTTLGYFPATMPEGWHMIPAFIAFSGLFSFAWAASSTMAMIGILNTALDAKSHPPK
ncbi:hypothetical protein [Polynucleobacter antarcticus]|nr:hypothetical protein [Polynucleobacter antarcticus]